VDWYAAHPAPTAAKPNSNVAISSMNQIGPRSDCPGTDSIVTIAASAPLGEKPEKLMHLDCHLLALSLKQFHLLVRLSDAALLPIDLRKQEVCRRSERSAAFMLERLSQPMLGRLCLSRCVQGSA